MAAATADARRASVVTRAPEREGLQPADRAADLPAGPSYGRTAPT